MSVRSKDYDAIFFSICDINGIPRGKIVFHPVIDRVIKHGMGITQASIMSGIMSDVPVNFTDYEKVGWRNGVGQPDPDTLKPVSWISPHKLGHMLCDMNDSEGMPDACSPRHVLKGQLHKLRQAGFALRVAQQFEFNICAKGSKAPLKQDEDLQVVISRLKSLLPENGIPLLDIEKGSKPWIVRLSLPSQEALTAADTTHRLRYVITSACAYEGHSTTFMTCPFSSAADSSSCTSYGLDYTLHRLDGQSNAFQDSTSGDISPLARHWLKGQARHVEATTALMRPTANCYHGAPRRGGISIEENIAKGVGRPYIRDTRPSSASNPYLVLAAVVASGLDGLQRSQTESTETVITQTSADCLPSLQVAMEYLEHGNEMRSFLGETFVKYFVNLKTAFEVNRFKDSHTKTDAEREDFARYVYFDSL